MFTRRLFADVAAIILLGASSAWADRTVHGRITHSDGTAAAGARVRIIDRDPSADDVMGTVYTDAAGNYSFTWPAGKIWDPPKTDHHVQWRPDILIKVKWDEGDSQWDAENESSIKDNCRHDTNHRFDLSLKPISRTVSGTIRDKNGPLTGARIRVWDADDIGSSDRMNPTDAFTDASGHYTVTYRGQVWDSPRIAGSTKWRPDIYITVASKRDTTFWSRVYVSSTHSDHPMARPLTIDVTLTDKCGWGEPLECSLPQLASFAAPHTNVSGKIFNSACVTHDYCYRHGNQTYGKSKSTCDKEFLADMQKLCTDAKALGLGILTAGVTVVTCSAWANEYYAAVALAGGSSYRPNGAMCQYK